MRQLEDIKPVDTNLYYSRHNYYVLVDNLSKKILEQGYEPIIITSNFNKSENIIKHDKITIIKLILIIQNY